MTSLLAPATPGRDVSAGGLVEGPAAAPTASQRGPRVLGSLVRAYWGRLLLAYVLVTSENLLQLSLPWALGRAINGLLQSSALDLVLLTLLHFGHLLVGAARRSYDARAFTRIYADLATHLVLEQHRREVEVSRIAARAALSREFVQFFQVYLPLVLQAVYSLVGALVMLCCYDWTLMLLCLGMLVPACVVNAFYSRKVLRLNARLHDELEQEVGVITTGDRDAVHGHYQRVSCWQIKLADSEALNSGTVEVLVIALLAVTLLRACTVSGVGAGDIVAVFRYVILFVTALDTLPVLIQHVSRLRDIGQRTQLAAPGGVEPSRAEAPGEIP